MQTVLELGLISSLTVLALFLSYTMLNVCDLSTDGCFTFGAAVGAIVALNGHPLLSIPLAMLAGVASGFITAILQTVLGIDSLLAGIVVNTGLYSINIAVMKKSSLLNLNSSETVFSLLKAKLEGTAFEGKQTLIIAFLAVFFVVLFLSLFLKTKLGLSIRATGNNPDMVKSSSINPIVTTIIGLCLANSFTALSGCSARTGSKAGRNQHRHRYGNRCSRFTSYRWSVCQTRQNSASCNRCGSRCGCVPFGISNRNRTPYASVYAQIRILDYRNHRNCRTVSQNKASRIYQKSKSSCRKEGAIMLTLSDVKMVFFKGTPDEKVALNNLSVEVNQGDFITIIGANGAGKSTLFNAIAGTYLTDAGRILLEGNDITAMPEHKRARFIGRLFQDPMKGSAPGMSIEENLALAAGHGGWLSTISKKDKKLFREKLALLGMGLEDRMNSPVGLLSGGQRQALTLMMATINPPKILLLDEHTAALDPGTAEKVLTLTNQIVAENKITCLMITHNMQSALDLGNRTIMMDKGRVVYDVANEERSGLTVPDLLEKFKISVGENLDNDRMLLS